MPATAVHGNRHGRHFYVWRMLGGSMYWLALMGMAFAQQEKTKAERTNPGAQTRTLDV